MSPTKKPDSKMVVVLFATGAGLVVASFTYAFIRRWPTFDPLVTAAIVGVGLLLIVIYERLGHMHTELRTIAYHLELLSAESKDRTTHPAGASEARADAR